MTEFKNINVTDLQVRMGERSICLVDVRSDLESARGIIPGAIKLPLHSLPLRVHEFDRAMPTVFYCQMGGRSAQAAAFAAEQGFADVYNLQGGIAAWERSGATLVTELAGTHSA